MTDPRAILPFICRSLVLSQNAWLASLILLVRGEWIVRASHCVRTCPVSRSRDSLRLTKWERFRKDLAKKWKSIRSQINDQCAVDHLDLRIWKLPNLSCLLACWNGYSHANELWARPWSEWMNEWTNERTELPTWPLCDRTDEKSSIPSDVEPYRQLSIQRVHWYLLASELLSVRLKQSALWLSR